ncbi:hypothetical protein FRC02_005612 [Tulasnella sp. 418]|nr:hypothetical protein FRC02_005612 [Tulasnella sp. 418]
MSRTTTLKDDVIPSHPNTWSKWRVSWYHDIDYIWKRCQLPSGLSSNNSVTTKDFGSYLSIPIGWGIGVALGTLLAGGISGAHLNPAVTLALSIFRRFPLRKLPIYALAQIAGAFFGSLIVYGNYWRAIDLFEGGSRTVPGTASLFTTFPLPYLSAGA